MWSLVKATTSFGFGVANGNFSDPSDVSDIIGQAFDLAETLKAFLEMQDEIVTIELMLDDLEFIIGEADDMSTEYKDALNKANDLKEKRDVFDTLDGQATIKLDAFNSA